MSADPVNTLTQQESSLTAEVCLGLSRTLGSAWRCRKQSWLLEEVTKVSQRDRAPVNKTGLQTGSIPGADCLTSHDQQSSEQARAHGHLGTPGLPQDTHAGGGGANKAPHGH